MPPTSMNKLLILYILSFLVSVVVEGFLLPSTTYSYVVHVTHDVYKTTQLLKNNNVVHVHKATRLILKSNNNGGNDGSISNIGRSILASSLSIAALLASVGTIYSEVSVIRTGCGPQQGVATLAF